MTRTMIKVGSQVWRLNPNDKDYIELIITKNKVSKANVRSFNTEKNAIVYKGTKDQILAYFESPIFLQDLNAFTSDEFSSLVGVSKDNRYRFLSRFVWEYFIMYESEKDYKLKKQIGSILGFIGYSKEVVESLYTTELSFKYWKFDYFIDETTIKDKLKEVIYEN